ncbi:ABC transporter substrate-binding protein [Halorubrum sp. DTA98]|uniref:ABC transporter substrate-binding protein n=1 Tax=Halorubrum sp. DTA98 TaxID=3402163 RepID=UPI003AABA604
MRTHTNSAVPTVDRRRFLELTGGSVGAAALAGCLGGDDEEDEILVGGLQPYTGPFSEVAQEFENGFEFALSGINADGGVLGRELVFDGVDTETSSGEAVSIGTQMIERDGAVALTGPISSDVGIQIANLAEEQEVPVVFNQVGSHAAIDRESRFSYRLGLLPAPTTAAAQAQFIEANEFDTVRAIIADYAYGRAFETAIESEFPDDIDMDTVVAPFGEDDFVPYLRDMPDDLDVLIATSHPAGAMSIFRQQRELDVDPEYVLGNSEANPVWNVLGEDVTEGWLSVHQPYPYSSEYRTVAEEFSEETGDYFGILASLGYVAAELIATAIEDAGEADPVAVSEAIRGAELESLFAEPVQYTEWGELQGKRQVLSSFETGAPDHHADGEFHLEEAFVSEPLDGFDPNDYDL